MSTALLPCVNLARRQERRLAPAAVAQVNQLLCTGQRPLNVSPLAENPSPYVAFGDPPQAEPNASAGCAAGLAAISHAGPPCPGHRLRGGEPAPCASFSLWPANSPRLKQILSPSAAFGDPPQAEPNVSAGCAAGFAAVSHASPPCLRHRLRDGVLAPCASFSLPPANGPHLKRILSPYVAFDDPPQPRPNASRRLRGGTCYNFACKPALPQAQVARRRTCPHALLSRSPCKQPRLKRFYRHPFAMAASAQGRNAAPILSRPVLSPPSRPGRRSPQKIRDRIYPPLPRLRWSQGPDRPSPESRRS